MQYRDGHISTCFNKDTVIYILCICSCQLFVIQYLFICAYLFIIGRSFILFIVRLFTSLLLVFIPHRFFVYCCSKAKRTILILNHVQVFRSRCTRWRTPVHHHQYESINIIQQTPPTLSLYRSEGPITTIDIVGLTKPISPHSSHSRGRDSNSSQ